MGGDQTQLIVRHMVAHLLPQQLNVLGAIHEEAEVRRLKRCVPFYNTLTKHMIDARV